MQTVGDACHYFNEHLIVEPNTPKANMESPLINMIQVINNLETSTSSYTTSKNHRSKKSNNVRPPPPPPPQQ